MSTDAEYSFIHFRYLYSAPSRFLLRGVPDYSADTESEFQAEELEQLRVKDLPRVPTWRLEVDSNPQPCGCKAPNIPHTTASIQSLARSDMHKTLIRHWSNSGVCNVGYYRDNMPTLRQR